MNLKDCTTPFGCRIWTELNAIVSDDFGNMALSIKPLDDAFMHAYELGQQQGWKLAISKAAHEARMGMVHTDAEEYSCSLIAERIRALKIPTQEVKVSNALESFERGVFNKATQEKAG